MTDPLEFDGERFTPECVREIWYEHIHRYAFAAQLVSGLKVLDAACGEGYGSAILSRSAKSVTAVDRSGKAIKHARRRYSLDNVEFIEADCLDLPFGDGSFDCIVSFETIEHLDDQAGMLAEFRRVLGDGGFLLISSPDKAVYSDQPQFDNEHHVRELYADEFCALLDEHFSARRLLGQKLLFHSAIWPLDAGRQGRPAGDGRRAAETPPDRPLLARLLSKGESGLEVIERPPQRPMYLLAVCAGSEAALPPVEAAMWLFDDEQESVYRHYQHEIRKNMAAGAILADRERELDEARRALAEERGEAVSRGSWLRFFRFNGRGGS